jgi:hypothetical protein
MCSGDVLDGTGQADTALFVFFETHKIVRDMSCKSCWSGHLHSDAGQRTMRFGNSNFFKKINHFRYLINVRISSIKMLRIFLRMCGRESNTYPHVGIVYPKRVNADRSVRN